MAGSAERGRSVDVEIFVDSAPSSRYAPGTIRGPNLRREADIDQLSEVLTVGSSRRQVAMVPWGDERLYASCYAATRPARPDGFVVVPSWGVELGGLQDLAHELARSIAEAGGAAVLFHPPGQGDSTGRPDHVSFDHLVAAAGAVHSWAAERWPAWRWGMVGLRVGAAVAAALSQEGAGTGRMLSIQPAFDPVAYAADLARAGRGGLGASADGLVFGHPPFPAPADSGGRPVGARMTVLTRPGGRTMGAVICDPSPDVPPGIEVVRVRTPWRIPLPIEARGSIVRVALEWLNRAAA